MAPLLLNISGRAGCGKSFFLNCVKGYVKERIPNRPYYIRTAGPTGTSAFGVGGETLHKLLTLPINYPSNKEIKPLAGDQLKSLQARFHDCHYLVIDEKSMISLLQLHRIDVRLKEARPWAADEPFGGISLIIMGDFAQLEPVMGKPLFASDKLETYEAHGRNSYLLFEKALSFKTVVRQQGNDVEQVRFREFLHKIATDGRLDREVDSDDEGGADRNPPRKRTKRDKQRGQRADRAGEFTLDDYKWIAQRSAMSIPDPEVFRRDAIKLCARNRDSNKFNIKRLRQLKTDVAVVKAINRPEGSAGKASSNKAGGMPKLTLMADGARVILLANLWKEVGLTNGAQGTVVGLKYLRGTRPPALPAAVLVKFDNYTGPGYEGKPGVVPIAPVSRDIQDSRVDAARTQIPMLPAYSISIHKSQGMSLDKVILNLGRSEFSSGKCQKTVVTELAHVEVFCNIILGLTYTGFSRCKDIRNFMLDPLPHYERIISTFNNAKFRTRLREDRRLRAMEAATLADLLQQLPVPNEGEAMNLDHDKDND